MTSPSHLRAATANTLERDRLEQQLQIATLELQLDELRLTIETLRREKSTQDESQQRRAGLIAEIWAEARALAIESRYRFAIPDGLGPTDLSSASSSPPDTTT